jgi:hypothetical protein
MPTIHARVILSYIPAGAIRLNLSAIKLCDGTVIFTRKLTVDPPHVYCSGSWYMNGGIVSKEEVPIHEDAIEATYRILKGGKDE